MGFARNAGFNNAMIAIAAAIAPGLLLGHVRYLRGLARVARQPLHPGDLASSCNVEARPVASCPDFYRPICSPFIKARDDQRRFVLLQVAYSLMEELIAWIGGLLFQFGVVAALVIVMPVLYGLVIVMRRWWLVLAIGIILLGLVAKVAFNTDIAAAVNALPEAMAPHTAGFSVIAVSYIVLAMVVRLSTLRLEWLGWQRKSIIDMHVLGYLVPTVAAVAMAVSGHA